MKLICALTLAVLAFTLLIARRDDLRVGLQAAQARAAKATVEDRLQQFETAAIQRLNPALKAKGFTYPLKRLALVAIKDTSLLQLYAFTGDSAAVHIKDYAVLAKSGSLGPKLREGDRQIPEGVYRVTFLNPNSLYHLSLRLDYPNQFDQKMAKRDGRSNLGGDIMIHGKDVSIGCIAVGDSGIEELFCLAARAGLKNIKVVIVPTDWRTRRFDAKAISGPPWLPALYTELNKELREFK